MLLIKRINRMLRYQEYHNNQEHQGSDKINRMLRYQEYHNNQEYQGSDKIHRMLRYQEYHNNQEHQGSDKIHGMLRYQEYHNNQEYQGSDSLTTPQPHNPQKTYIFWSKFLPVSSCSKFGINSLSRLTISSFS